MGLLDRLKPAPLLRSGPLLLLPSGTSPETVDALVASWAPLRRRKGDAWQLADGLRWIGPVEVTMSDVTEHDLPGGYPIAYVAQAKRSRGDGLADRMLDKLDNGRLDREMAALDAQLIATGETTAEELERARAESEARSARDYPQGEPLDVEGDAWRLVCGLARRLGGRCRLADGVFFLPDLLERDEPTLYARTLLEPSEVAELLATELAPLEPADPRETTGHIGDDDGDEADFWALRGGEAESRVWITADEWPRDVEERIAGIDPSAAYDTFGGRPVSYQFSGPPGSGDQLLRACAVLAPHVDGCVIDEEGFPLT